MSAGDILSTFQRCEELCAVWYLFARRQFLTHHNTNNNTPIISPMSYGGGSYGGGSYGGGGSRGGPSSGGDRMSSLGANLRDLDYSRLDNVVQATWQTYTGNNIQQVDQSNSEVDAWRREHGLTIIGDRIPNPLMNFSDLAAPEGVHRAFQDQGFKAPTPIQAQAWPIVLSARDLVGIAKTGSGKTMAFMVPAIVHILAQPPLKLGDGPIALVLAPTRELALQIEEETRKVSQRCDIRVTCLYGGAPKHPQMRTLRAGVHVAIATPGRLIDMLDSQATNLYRVTYLVMDEADRMLDMGFEPQIRKVVGQIRPDRQTLMFSATWPPDVRSLAATFQRDFVRLHVGSLELMANADVTQHIVVLQSSYDKPQRLFEVLERHGRARSLVFVATKRMVDELVHMLRDRRINAYGIHGDKDQSQRERVLECLKRQEDACLVATDVAARGLDVKNLDLVVNFDLPNAIEDYVHRIGMSRRFPVYMVSREEEGIWAVVSHFVRQGRGGASATIQQGGSNGGRIGVDGERRLVDWYLFASFRLCLG